MERQGYEVVTASSVQQALEVLAASKIDLILSDQLMPGGTGTDLTRAVKSMYPGLPVVLISGVNEIPPDAIYADLFLSKVEGPLSMCKHIENLLALRSLI